MDNDNIALFDMDGTLADYEGRLLTDLGQLASPGDPEPRIPWNDRGEPWLEARMRLIKSQPGWWLGLDRLPCGFMVLDLVRRAGFRVHVLTKGPRAIGSAWGEKLEWCQQHLGEDVDVTITQDKGLVYGRVLVDDYPPYMEQWLKHRPRGLGLMPDTEYNRDFKHPNVIKYPRSIRPYCPDFQYIAMALQIVAKRATATPG